jgi:L-threonylcarbamoyladenylate synthase
MMAHIGTDIALAARLLIAGEVVAIPTETVYGLAGNAFDDAAIQKIYAAKGRPANNPLIVHIAHLEGMDAVAQDIPELARTLAAAFWPGPLTLVLPKRAHVPASVTAGLPTVGVRVPDHALTRALLEVLPFPLAAPSANPFGYISPTSAVHVQQQLGDKIAYVLDGGPCKAGIESTIVGFEDGLAVIYRLGAIPAEAILRVIGAVQLHGHGADKVLSPGMLPYHYSPATRFVLCEDIAAILGQYDAATTGTLSLDKVFDGLPAAHQFQLSATADLVEAAQNLYAHLHLLDALGLSVILAERMPMVGLGPSINDRLMRAAAAKVVG